MRYQIDAVSHHETLQPARRLKARLDGEPLRQRKIRYTLRGTVKISVASLSLLRQVIWLQNKYCNWFLNPTFIF